MSIENVYEREKWKGKGERSIRSDKELASDIGRLGYPTVEKGKSKRRSLNKQCMDRESNIGRECINPVSCLYGLVSIVLKDFAI
ncbi:hypothetical protein HZH66_010498 [Vespula vulgaris]|uniref:Uncharacterized protein n=1 Tax=Vespula vulgaris TaxID=7454 RepID=A0A834JIZ2_VESVU|nr:hypothetical protein HZH66_010498 [Vespula vulgaris]